MLSILSEDQLQRLGDHKYSAEGCSLLDPLMQKFWRWLVEQIPETWAPNSLTIAGLLLNIVATLILAFYSPDAKHEVSNCNSLKCSKLTLMNIDIPYFRPILSQPTFGFVHGSYQNTEK